MEISYPSTERDYSPLTYYVRTRNRNGLGVWTQSHMGSPTLEYARRVARGKLQGDPTLQVSIVDQHGTEHWTNEDDT